MRHALVFGGSGQIGYPLLGLLQTAGWRITAVSRNAHADEPGLHWLRGELGNAPRMNGDVRRPWNLTENLSVAKTVSVSSRLRLDVRAEVFNLFNRVVWGAPEQNFNSANFGQITSQANSPRQMQFGVKLYW